MNRVIKIALIQQHASEDVEENITRGVESFEIAADKGSDIICFAELAFTPFYPQSLPDQNVSSVAETIPGPTTEVFSALSKKHGVITILNLFEKKEDKTFDSSPLIDDNGKILGITRMVHIIESLHFHEKNYYSPGDGKSLVYDTGRAKIGIAICYDRHFPEYMRRLGLLGAELVVIPQAGSVDEWPSGIFEAEMQIAGFQNGYFTALCNRVGKEKYLTFEGKSFVTAPDGRIVAQAPKLEDTILYAEIDLDEVKNSHARSHFLIDRRPEIYHKWKQ